MIFVMKKYDTEGGWLRVESTFFSVCRVGSNSWVINDEDLWLISREQFAVDTYMSCKGVEAGVLIFSVSVISKWLSSNKNELDGLINSEIWGMKFIFSSFRLPLIFLATFFRRILRRVINTLKCFSLTFIKFSVK